MTRFVEYSLLLILGAIGFVSCVNVYTVNPVKEISPKSYARKVTFDFKGHQITNLLTFRIAKNNEIWMRNEVIDPLDDTWKGARYSFKANAIEPLFGKLFITRPQDEYWVFSLRYLADAERVWQVELTLLEKHHAEENDYGKIGSSIDELLVFEDDGITFAGAFYGEIPTSRNSMELSKQIDRNTGLFIQMTDAEFEKQQTNLKLLTYDRCRFDHMATEVREKLRRQTATLTKPAAISYMQNYSHEFCTCLAKSYVPTLNKKRAEVFVAGKLNPANDFLYKRMMNSCVAEQISLVGALENIIIE